MLEGVAIVADMAVRIVIVDQEIIIISKDIARSEVRRWKLNLLWACNLEYLLAVVGEVATRLIAEICRGLAIARNLYRIIHTYSAVVGGNNRAPRAFSIG